MKQTIEIFRTQSLTSNLTLHWFTEDEARNFVSDLIRKANEYGNILVSYAIEEQRDGEWVKLCEISNFEDKPDIWESLENELKPAAEKAEAMQELYQKLHKLGVTPTRPLQIKISVYPEFNEVVLKRDDEYFSVMTNEIDGLIEHLTKAKQEINEFGSD